MGPLGPSGQANVQVDQLPKITVCQTCPVFRSSAVLYTFSFHYNQTPDEIKQWMSILIETLFRCVDSYSFLFDYLSPSESKPCNDTEALGTETCPAANCQRSVFISFIFHCSVDQWGQGWAYSASKAELSSPRIIVSTVEPFQNKICRGSEQIILERGGALGLCLGRKPPQWKSNIRNQVGVPPPGSSVKTKI